MLSHGGGGSFVKTEAGMESGALVMEEPTNEGQHLLDTFWQRCMEDCMNLNPNNDFKVQELPLARIKKIMKLDEDVKMISAEAPIIFAKACELFVAELTTRAWIHTEESKRRTLQKTDVALAVSKYDMFDFLIDIVPRDEIKVPQKGRSGSGADQVQYLVQLPASAVNGSNGGQPITLNLGGQQILIGDISQQQNSGGATTVVNSQNPQQPQQGQMIQIPLSQIVYDNSSGGGGGGTGNLSVSLGGAAVEGLEDSSVNNGGVSGSTASQIHHLTTADGVPVIIQSDGTSYYATTAAPHEPN